MKKTNICRCCLTSGCIKDLSNEYLYIGKLENYGEMLNQTFNLTINPKMDKYICEECITKLRDAASFKQQIININKTFSTLSSLKTDSENPQLVEIIETDYDGSSFYQPDLETEAEIFEAKSESIEESSDRKNNKIVKTKKKQSNVKEKNKTSTDRQTLQHQRENSINLISNSNICLFKSLRTRFACYVCNEKFFDIKELRNHSKVHSIDDFKRRIKRLRGKSYENADISNLQCSICAEKCMDLEFLRTHLTKHGILFGDASHILIPYKLEEGFKCDVCFNIFNTFTRLSIHMNIHATSNICENCGISFYNRVSLRNHVRAVHREHKCADCSLRFQTITKLVRHKRRTHGLAPAKHHCPRCHMTFRYPYLLKKHAVEKHNAVYVTVECGMCKRIFKDCNTLKTHIRSVHLNERNFSCTLCDLRFFTRTDRARHEKTHQGGSFFSCHMCETRFKSKDSVRRHLKKQHGTIQLNK